MKLSLLLAFLLATVLAVPRVGNGQSFKPDKPKPDKPKSETRQASKAADAEFRT
jgi:hypothetical protein